MATKIKIGSDVLRSFTKEDDIRAWIRNVSLVVKPQGIQYVVNFITL